MHAMRQPATQITVTRSGSLVRACAIAPQSYYWSASHVHELVAEARGGREATRDVTRDVRERIAYGIDRCTDPDCDWCHAPAEVL